MSMDDAEDHDGVDDDAKEHAVRKTMNNGPTLLTVNERKALGPREHFGHGRVDFQHEFLAEPRPLCVEPIARLNEFRRRLRSNDQPCAHR